MKKRTSILFAAVTAFVFGLFSAEAAAQNAPTPQQIAQLQSSLTAKISRDDWRLILPKDSPQTSSAATSEAQNKEEQIQGVRKLLALANEAVKTGLVTSVVFGELEYIRSTQTALDYDKSINKSQNAFALIVPKQIEKFYLDENNRAAFAEFSKNRILLRKEIRSDSAEPTPEEIAEMRRAYAQAKIYERLFAAEKNSADGEAFRSLALRIRLQQAQFLARYYSEKVLAAQIKVSDEEVEKYIAASPQYDTKAKRARAQKILLRARAGENFARLARLFTEDPSTKNNGGLYQDVSNGAFIPEFENVVRALKPGQIAPELVETPYGFHIVKLESRKAESYTVRQILISTMIDDPADPSARNIPVKEYVRTKLEDQKEQTALERILRNNPVEVESY